MYNRMAVYVVAHQDDWQLFMDPLISNDINAPGCRTLIIHTTAGDAGDGRKYWRAREAGAVNSLKFRISHDTGKQLLSGYIKVNKKKIFRTQAAHCSIYFLRLPDGGPYGEGFARYGFQSLSKLRRNSIGQIHSVDGLNCFSSFSEIGRLLDNIINRELQAGLMKDDTPIVLNFPEYDNNINPDDHNDHLNTALLLMSMKVYATAGKRAFVHYHIQHVAPDLDGTELFWKVGMFSVYHQTVLDLHGHSTIGETHQYCIWSRKNIICRDIL